MGTCTCINCLIWFSIIFDFLSDWAQFIEIAVEQDYNKAGDGVFYALLAFCIWGTLTFFIEIYIMCKKEKYLPIIDFVTIWTEDVPQIVLTVIIAYHTSEVGSLIQVIKAIATILEVVIKTSIGCCKSCRDDYKDDRECDCNTLNVVTGIGYALTVIGAILVLCFAMITIDQDGVWHFHEPTLST